MWGMTHCLLYTVPWDEYTKLNKLFSLDLIKMHLWNCILSEQAFDVEQNLPNRYKSMFYRLPIVWMKSILNPPCWFCHVTFHNSSPVASWESFSCTLQNLIGSSGLSLYFLPKFYEGYKFEYYNNHFKNLVANLKHFKVVTLRHPLLIKIKYSFTTNTIVKLYV